MINNLDNWWKAVDDNLDDLLEIISHHLDYDSPAYNSPGDNFSQLTGRNIGEEINYLIQNRDQKLVRYLNSVWWLTSKAYAADKAAWGILCDLCSEEWVFRKE